MDRLLELISNLFDIDKEDLGMDTKREELDEWDSLAHIQLILELESEYDIKIPFEEVVEINSIKDILKYIE